MVSDASVIDGDNMRPFDFRFPDNQQWQDAVYSIVSTPEYGVPFEGINYFQKLPGRFFSTWGYGINGEWTWTFKATGYQDVVVKVVVTHH